MSKKAIIVLALLVGKGFCMLPAAVSPADLLASDPVDALASNLKDCTVSPVLGSNAVDTKAQAAAQLQHYMQDARTYTEREILLDNHLVSAVYKGKSFLTCAAPYLTVHHNQAFLHKTAYERFLEDAANWYENSAANNPYLNALIKALISNLGQKDLDVIAEQTGKQPAIIWHIDRLHAVSYYVKDNKDRPGKKYSVKLVKSQIKPLCMLYQACIKMGYTIIFVSTRGERSDKRARIQQDAAACGFKLHEYNFKMVPRGLDSLVADYLQSTLLPALAKDYSIQASISDDYRFLLAGAQQELAVWIPSPVQRVPQEKDFFYQLETLHIQEMTDLMAEEE